MNLSSRRALWVLLLLAFSATPTRAVEVAGSDAFEDRSSWKLNGVRLVLEGWNDSGAIRLSGSGEMDLNAQTVWAFLAMNLCSPMGELRFNPKYAKTAAFLRQELKEGRLKGEMAWCARSAIAMFGLLSHDSPGRGTRRALYVSGKEFLEQIAESGKIDLPSCVFALMLQRVGLRDLRPKDRVYLTPAHTEKLKTLLSAEFDSAEADRLARVQATLGLALLHRTDTDTGLSPKLREALKGYSFETKSPDWDLWFHGLIACSLLSVTDVPGRGCLGIPGLLAVEYKAEGKAVAYQRARQLLLYAIYSGLVRSNLGHYPPIEGAMAEFDK